MASAGRSITMQRTLGDQPDHVIHRLQAFVAVGFTATHPWSFGHLQDPYGIFQLPDEDGILSVLLLRRFGALPVDRVGFGDALKGLGGVESAAMMATFLRGGYLESWLSALQFCTA